MKYLLEVLDRVECSNAEDTMVTLHHIERLKALDKEAKDVALRTFFSNYEPELDPDLFDQLMEAKDNEQDIHEFITGRSVYAIAWEPFKDYEVQQVANYVEALNRDILAVITGPQP